MATINQVKQLAAADTPILFFQCEMPSGDTYYWSSHSILFEGNQYAARVLKHNLFNLQLSADDAMDGISQLSIVFGNADALMSELEAAIGFKGAQLSVHFAFVNLSGGQITTEAMMLFRGVAGDPEEITDETLTLSFTNKLSLQRIAIPDARVQHSCPWNFPATADQRGEAINGGAFGRFSKFYRCGYSADVPGGVGNLNGGQAYDACDKSRSQCQQRGMFSTDSHGNINNRFGGFDFVPTSYLVRGANDKTAHAAAVIDNTAKYNDPVPMVYGTGWLKAPVVFSRNDGNLTHMEVLLGLGPIQGILKVVVNDVEIPVSNGASSLPATGWYSLLCRGDRQGAFNMDFVDSAGVPQGDPHGSMAVLSVVVPNAISPGTSSPTVQVLMTGIQLDTYDLNGVRSAPEWGNNPAWIVMDVLQRAGWSPSDLDVKSFFQTSIECAQTVTAIDRNGKSVLKPRYGCNLVLNKRQSAAAVVRGIRVASGLMLRYGASGLLELLPEGTLAFQQSTLPDGSNSVAPLNNGWPAYEFSDASSNFSGIARNSHGGSTLILTAKSISECSNRISVEFQDEDNEYQQDSLSVSDSNDANLIGFEVASQSNAMGLPNFNQTTRILLRQLDKSVSGNQYVQFQTSFRALKVKPGDIITITYAREGFMRMPFRVIKISPSLNYELVTILAQVHDDAWYSDDLRVLENSGRQPNSATATPRPLLGVVPRLDTSGKLEYFDFALSDVVSAQSDGSAIDSVMVGFSLPSKPSALSTNLPLVNLSPVISTTDGTLSGGSNWYYAVTAVDATGAEGSLSFAIPSQIPATTDTNTVALQGLSFPTGAVAFNVYRGESPQALYQIKNGCPIADTFLDVGFPALPVGPPDASFDHANFYYRNEYAGPFIANAPFSSSTLTCDSMGAVLGAYAGMVALITEGAGRGQERSIVSNTDATLTLLNPWSISPDSSSVFVIAEAAWKLAAISAHSPARFDIPFRSGGVIQITGRSANIQNQESNPNLEPITRMHLGGGNIDAGLPAMPFCTLETPGGGDLTVSNVGFSDLTNVDTVTSGTLQLFYWDETKTPSPYSLSETIAPTDGSINITGPAASLFTGQYIQIDQEILSIISVGAEAFSVFRGAENSIAASHSIGTPVMPLKTYTIVMPFAAGFFGNRASSNYIHTVNIPDVRISAAELSVANAFGSGPASVTCYTGTGSLRTLSGGQYSLQINGYLATQQNAAPPLLVQATHAVRDLRLTLSQPPAGYVITVDLFQTVAVNGKLTTTQYAQLSFDPSQAVESQVMDGLNLPPLLEQATLTMNLTLTLIPNYTQALNPGRDLTLTIRM